MLTALEEAEPWILPNGRKQRRYLCLCDCGKTCYVRVNDFRSNKSTSCGCRRNKQNHDRNFEDLTNQVFGRLKVLYRVEDYVKKSNEKRVQWLCKCDCGNEVKVTSLSLKSGNTKSCGCYKTDSVRERCFKNITGNTYGHLKVLSFDHMDGKHSIYKCLCDCGTICYTSANHLKQRHTTSCGHICSIAEDEVNQYLKTNKFEYEYHVAFKDLYYKSYLEFDFGIYCNKTLVALIECQGRQHYDDVGKFGSLQRNVTDNLKTQYCRSKNIPLYYIRYDENSIVRLKTILADLHVNPVPNMTHSHEGATTIHLE